MLPAPILYLDYDGVLHPADVKLVRRRPTVFVDGKQSDRPLFEHVGLLEQALEPYPALRIILATSWVKHLRFTYAKSRLTPALQSRVMGATWHSHMRRDRTAGGLTRFDALSRYETIKEDAQRRRTDRWLSLDDDLTGWPADELHRVVAPTDPILALGQPGVVDELRAALARLCASTE